MTISVLITYFNERELLTECLESLRRQTIPVDEILIYDDASAHPALNYVPGGLPVRVIRSCTNRGPSCGRNALMWESRSEFIHFHDSDDLFHPEWSREVRNRCLESGVDSVFTELAFFGEDGKAPGEGALNLRSLGRGGDFVRFCLENAMLTPSGTYRRCAVIRVGGYREKLWQAEDFDFHVRLAASGVSFELIDKVLVLCRLRPGSRSRDRIELWTCAVQAVEMLSQELAPEYRRELSDRAAWFGSLLFRLGAQDAARVAFRLVSVLGPPRFSGQRPLYRGLARMLGPEVSERACSSYRDCVPEALRRAVAGLGL